MTITIISRHPIQYLMHQIYPEMCIDVNVLTLDYGKATCIGAPSIRQGKYNAKLCGRAAFRVES